jgi:hypothetical protein
MKILIMLFFVFAGLLIVFLGDAPWWGWMIWLYSIVGIVDQID